VKNRGEGQADDRLAASLCVYSARTLPAVLAAVAVSAAFCTAIAQSFTSSACSVAITTLRSGVTISKLCGLLVLGGRQNTQQEPYKGRERKGDTLSARSYRDRLVLWSSMYTRRQRRPDETDRAAAGEEGQRRACTL
jgi:hypothetical protein